MADTKISSLAAVTSLLTTDELVLARAGTTKKITVANLRLALGGPALIQEISVGAGGAATVDFTSIPGIYRHLEMAYVARSEGAAGDVNLRFNNDSAANYRVEVVRGVGSGAGAATLSAQTSANIISVPATGSGYDSHGKIYFPYYATGAFNRTAFSTYAQYDGSSTNVGMFGAYWSGTAAVTQITLLIAGSIDIKQGSIFSLYGIL